jgi:hypothetical protein
MGATNGSHTPELISRAELARRRGCSRAAVTLACRERLAAAVHGRQVDAAHPETRLWLAATDRAPTAPAPRQASKALKASRSVGRAAGRAAARDLRDRNELFEMALRKKRAETEALEFKLLERKGQFVERELVARAVFAYLATLSARLLRDLPKTLATRVPALRTHEERQAAISKANSEAIARAKEAALRALREPARPPRSNGSPERSSIATTEPVSMNGSHCAPGDSSSVA